MGMAEGQSWRSGGDLRLQHVLNNLFRLAVHDLFTVDSVRDAFRGQSIAESLDGFLDFLVRLWYDRIDAHPFAGTMCDFPVTLSRKLDAFVTGIDGGFLSD
jgi:hypothetical protein